MRTYCIGTLKGSGNGHKQDTLIVQARRNQTFLSCELWQYLGEHIITKKQLRERKQDILKETNKLNNTAFTRVIID